MNQGARFAIVLVTTLIAFANTTFAKSDDEVIIEAVSESIAKAYANNFAREYVEQAVNAALPPPPADQMPVGSAIVFVYDFINAGKAMGAARDPEEKLMSAGQMATTIIGLANPPLGAILKAAQFVLQITLNILNSKHAHEMMKLDLQITESYRVLLAAYSAQVNGEIAYIQNLLLSAQSIAERINKLHLRMNQEFSCADNQEQNLDACFQIVEDIVSNQILFLSLSERIILYQYQYVPVIRTLQKLDIPTEALASAALQGTSTFKMLGEQLKTARLAYTQSRTKKIFDDAESREHISGKEQLIWWCIEHVEKIKTQCFNNFLNINNTTLDKHSALHNNNFLNMIDALCIDHREENSILNKSISLIERFKGPKHFTEFLNEK